MIKISIDLETGVVSVEPQAPLEKSDFDRLDEMVDPIIAGGDKVRRSTTTEFSKTALVTDSALGGVAESAAGVLHFANIQHFSYADMVSAQQWLQAPD